MSSPPTPSPAVSARRRALSRGAYLLPSLFTISNILLGFYAVIRGLEGEFGRAALYVFMAAVIDTLDGRIARATNTESDFGREYDSLADVLTFGCAPALLTYLWGLRALDRQDAWLLPLFFLVCCATRLARFNVQHKVVDARFFVGMPAPAAAGSILSILFFVPSPTAEQARWLTPVTGAALVLIGLLMVSTFRYRSFKSLDLRKRWSFRALVPIAAIVLTIVYVPRATFLAIGVLFTLSGPLGWLMSRLRPSGSPSPTPPPSAEQP